MVKTCSQTKLCDCLMSSNNLSKVHVVAPSEKNCRKKTGLERCVLVFDQYCHHLTKTNMCQCMRQIIEYTTDQNNFNYLQSKIYPEGVPGWPGSVKKKKETLYHLLNECPCFQQAHFDIPPNQTIINTPHGTQPT